MTNRSDLAMSLASRVPFDVSKPMFDLRDVARGRGWSGTVNKINDKTAIASSKIALLTIALKEHEIVGEKLCSFYRLSDGGMKALRASVKTAVVAKGLMQNAYPYLLSEAKLKKLPLSQPVLLSVGQFEGGTAVVFGSVRALRVRQSFNPKSFTGAAKALAEFDEVIGLKLIRHQALDVIWIPDNGNIIDLRVDFPKGTHADVGGASQNSAMAAFIKIAGSNPFSKPVNLFPLLGEMYDTVGEGRVVELAFGTSTRSIKHERMRVSADCLRSELYHVGGKKNLVDPVRPYKISIAYTIDRGNEIKIYPELNLHTTTQVSESSNPELYDAVIRKTVGLFDYAHVRGRILHYLK